MAVAHVYRDSLVWHGHRPTAAMLLLPSTVEAEWLATTEFQLNTGVGAVAVGDGAA